MTSTGSAIFLVELLKMQTTAFFGDIFLPILKVFYRFLMFYWFDTCLLS